MSITSVGASFGYINPNAVAGLGAATVRESDADERASPSSPSQRSDGNQAQLSGTGAPQFASATQSALLVAQEQATSWQNYKVPFAAET